jgi:hypothetical protein
MTRGEGIVNLNKAFEMTLIYKGSYTIKKNNKRITYLFEAGPPERNYP